LIGFPWYNPNLRWWIPQLYTFSQSHGQFSRGPIWPLYICASPILRRFVIATAVDRGRHVVKVSQCWPLARQAHPSQHHFTDPYYNLARTRHTNRWCSSLSIIKRRAHLVDPLPPPNLTCNWVACHFPSSAPLSKHTGHFRRLRHSLSIKLFPLSFPTMWRRVKLLQLSVLSPSLFPEARPLKVGANITKKKLERRATRGRQSQITNYGSFSRDVWFRRLGHSDSVHLFCASAMLVFSFSRAHSAPASPWASLMLCEETHVSIFAFEFESRRVLACPALISFCNTFLSLERFRQISLANLGTRFLLRG
jgi:hypothetical protein